MRVLFVGDIFGSSGRRVLAERLAPFIAEHNIDLCIANGENCAGGRGCTQNILKKLKKHGVNVVTGGNHSFSNADIIPALENDPFIIRPLNFPPGNPGRGSTVFTLPDGRKAGIINLQGRTFFNESLDCPFRAGIVALNEMRRETNVIVVDFHAEASSEKCAFANYIDGKASAVLGTHTHVQTADERILPNGTAFITDAGMTGPEGSVIGMKAENVMQRFLLQTPVRFEPSEEKPMLNAIELDIDDSTGRALSISRIFERITFK
jgi:metallophosphoesterase (TIGR00282 family)